MMHKGPLKFIGMRGLGDNLYQRAFLSKLSNTEVFLETPWPQLYTDMPHVKPVKSVTSLRTQNKNMNTLPESIWHKCNMRGAKAIAYGSSPILAGMKAAFGFSPGEFTLPPLEPPPIRERDYVLVRPVTVRSEWRADTRNCLPEYVAEAADICRQQGLTVVSVADLANGAEWAIEPLPVSDHSYHNGELNVLELLSMVANAKIVIGPVGWIVPATISAKVPAWIISGGQGGYNSPERICPRGFSNVHFAVPDNFCNCKFKQHDCDKRINKHAERFAELVSRVRNGMASETANGL